MAADSSRDETCAELVLRGEPLDATVAFFCERLGFRLETIFPADRPTVAVVTGHGIRLRFDSGFAGAPGFLRIPIAARFYAGDGIMVAPNGTRIEWVSANADLVIPELVPSHVLTRFHSDADWSVGRAGMRYRDLIPNRLGGRFIASHIHIPGGGAVADYPHYHDVRFQMIFCHRGNALVAYEDQGEPFVLEAGDCVLQPPRIRHRVFESSNDLEVIEIACPGEHKTHVDHAILLGAGAVVRERIYSGQRFLRHVARSATWSPWRLPGFLYRDTGVGDATSGLAGCRVVRKATLAPTASAIHTGEFVFFFVRSGDFTLQRKGKSDEVLRANDALVIPAGCEHAFAEASPDLELLEVTLPAEIGGTPAQG